MARVQALPRPGYNPGVTRHLLAAILAAILLVAERPTPVAGQAKAASDAVVATTLDNGLRVLLLEDHRSPIVSLQVWYRVGSRNELRGATGIAHFLEHLMFRGTPTHGPGVYARTVERNGGQNNAFTTQDVTSYYVDIAADRLDLDPRARGRPDVEPGARPQDHHLRARGRDRGAAHAHRGRSRAASSARR